MHNMLFCLCIIECAKADVIKYAAATYLFTLGNIGIRLFAFEELQDIPISVYRGRLMAHHYSYSNADCYM